MAERMIQSAKQRSKVSKIFNTFLHVKRCDRQEDFLSPTMFILRTELEIMLRQNTRNRALKIDTELVKVSLFADDTYSNIFI